MKITFLITGLARGGAETQLLRIADKLQDKRYDVHVVSMMKEPDEAHKISTAGLACTYLNIEQEKFQPRKLWETVRLLRRLSPDVLICFCFHANLLGGLAGKIAGIPIIICSIRGERFGSKSREYAERLFDNFRLRNITTTNSQSVADSLVQRKVIQESRIIAIPNGIMIEQYQASNGTREKVRKQLELDPTDFLWLAVGNVRPPKDYQNLLKAFHIVAKTHNNMRLKIVGAFNDATYWESIRTLISDKLDGKVEFLGARDDVVDLLAAADALVLSSVHEGLPNVVMEAMAAKLPVVATNVGGVQELVQDGISGFIVPASNAEALAESMSRLMNLDTIQRNGMGLIGQEHIRHKFGLDIIVEQWENLISEQSALMKV